MRNQGNSAIIISYTELEKAIYNATRRYFLARNPHHALETELPQACADNQYPPGFFHGAAGNVRALNILMQLHELDDDKTSESYKIQLTRLLFAIIDPFSSSLGRSEWLVTILANTLIHGTFSILDDRAQIITRRNTLSSSVFSKTILLHTINSALVALTADTGMISHYDKLQAVRAILIFMHIKLTPVQKTAFDEGVAILKSKLAQPHKIDITETALSFRG